MESKLRYYNPSQNLLFFDKKTNTRLCANRSFHINFFSYMNFFDIPHLSVVFFLKILFQEAWEK